MSIAQYRDIQVGDSIPQLTLRPLDRSMLALYAGASGDHNPIHIDFDFARRSRAPDVFAHGMLSAAYLGRLLTQWVPQRNIRRLAVRFVGITQLGHIPQLSGRVVEKLEVNGESCVRLEVQCANQYGEAKILGDALIALA